MSDLAQLPPDVRALLDRAAAGLSRTRDPVGAAVEAALLQGDERTRAGVAAGFRLACATLERAIVGGDAATAEALAKAGTLGIGGLADELAARVRLEHAAQSLPFDAGADAASPSLLVRLAHSSDPRVAQTATRLLTAENRRDGEGGAGIDLPPHLHAMLGWRVAAAAPGDDAVLADGARRAIDGYDGEARLEAAAMGLARLIDARADELPALIGEALSDRRLALLAALIAHALGWTYETARALLIEPGDARLGLALRALDLQRDTIARTMLLLIEAAPGGDAEAAAEVLETLTRLPVATAAQAIAPLALPAEYRSAAAALTGGPR